MTYLRELFDRIRGEHLRRRITELEAELRRAQEHARIASEAQSALDRKAGALKKDWPQIWERYFSGKSAKGPSRKYSFSSKAALQ